MSTSISMTQPAHLTPEYLAEDNSRPLFNVLIAFIIIETIVFIMFVTSRFILKNYKGIETWCFMPLGFLFCLSSCIAGILMIKSGGVGRHTAYYLAKDPEKIIKSLKLAVAQEFLYAFSITFPKLAIIALYLRIFMDKWIRRITWLMGIIIAMNGFSIFITILSLCRPIAYRWNPSINGRCGDRMAFYRFASVPNLFTDVAILLLPWSTLCTLKMSYQRKAGVFLTFLTGALGIVTAIIRFVRYCTKDLFSDPLRSGTDMEIWTVIEPGAYFLCASLPGLRPLLRLVGESSLYSRSISWLHSRTWTQRRASLQSTLPRHSKEVRHSPDNLSAMPSDGSSTKRAPSTGSNSLEDVWIEKPQLELDLSQVEAGMKDEDQH